MAETLDRLFDGKRVSDPRYQGVYGAARELYLDLVRGVVGAEHGALMGAVEERRRELSRVVGAEIELVEDASLKDVQAVAETAWKRGGTGTGSAMRPRPAWSCRTWSSMSSSTSPWSTGIGWPG